MEAIEAEDLSTKEFAVEDDESSMDEPKVKLGGGGLSEREKSLAKDLSTKELAVEDDESSTEEPEVKLGGGGLSEMEESIAEAGRGGLLSAG
jgi:hypothetical protein